MNEKIQQLVEQRDQLNSEIRKLMTQHKNRVKEIAECALSDCKDVRCSILHYSERDKKFEVWFSSQEGKGRVIVCNKHVDDPTSGQFPRVIFDRKAAEYEWLYPDGDDD